MKIPVFKQVLEGITGLDISAVTQAQEYQNKLLKPLGSLGLLEEISVQCSGISGQLFNKVDKRILVQFGADNGVYVEGIASTPQHFTNMLIQGYASGVGSAINVLCKRYGVDLKLVDIGIIGTIDDTGIDNRRLMEGTNNMAVERAMPRAIAQQAVEIGIAYAAYAKEHGYEIIGTGEIGMGNTTTAAACICAALQQKDIEAMVGRGAGLTPEALHRKQQVVRGALELHCPDPADPLDILSAVGGLDIAALCGLYLGAAYYRIPIVIDGLIAIAAAVLAVILQPLAVHFMFPSHCSAEPAYLVAAEYLGLTPYLNLHMRLGEGSGCPLAMEIIATALRLTNTMGTFAEKEGDYRQRF